MQRYKFFHHSIEMIDDAVNSWIADNPHIEITGWQQDILSTPGFSKQNVTVVFCLEYRLAENLESV